MSDRNLVVLGKILEEMELARSMTADCDIDSFLGDEILKRAACMTVINIGELVKSLDMDFREAHPEVPWKDMAGFRDITAHTYQSLRMEDLFITVTDEFSCIAEDIRTIREGASPSE